jgi:hypothetical protein
MSAALFLLLAFPIQAIAPAETCASIDTNLPTELSGWGSTGTGVALGSSFVLPAANGGATASIPIARGGRYRIALDQPGWIDVMRGEQVIESVAHGHGPRCSSIRKIVDFNLQPGTYTLRLSKLQKGQARLMIFGSALQAG